MTAQPDDAVTHEDCWLAYFDLLGFAPRAGIFATRRYAEHTCSEPEDVNFVDGLEYLARGCLEKVIEILENEVKRQSGCGRTLYYAYFSDTLILYAPGSSLDSFQTIDTAGCNVFTEIVHQVSPLRGAITYGRFYADRSKYVFEGPALVDAHEYGERQDWIGYVLTPMAIDAMRELKPPIVSPSTYGNYIEWDVPVKVEKKLNCCGKRIVAVETKPLFAFDVACDPVARGSIREMKKMARNESIEKAEKDGKKAGSEAKDGENKWKDYYGRYRLKYINTLLFMKRMKLGWRVRRVDGVWHKDPVR